MVVLEPSTNWLLDYADDHCALRRIFGESGQQIRLELRQSMRSDRFEVRVSLSDFSRTPGGLETRFLDGAEFAPRFQIAQFRTGEGGEGFIYHESLMAPDVMLETELSRDAVAAENRARALQLYEHTRSETPLAPTSNCKLALLTKPFAFLVCA